MQILILFFFKTTHWCISWGINTALQITAVGRHCILKMLQVAVFKCAYTHARTHARTTDQYTDTGDVLPASTVEPINSSLTALTEPHIKAKLYISITNKIVFRTNSSLYWEEQTVFCLLCATTLHQQHRTLV